MSKRKPLLLLFDGNALVHRAFHAIPPLSISRTGEMVNAVYGFVATLLKVLADTRPTHWAIAFDYPAPTFRHEKFAEYKAHRPHTPKELSNQIQRVHEVAEAFRMPTFEVEGFEADDILATLGRQAGEQVIDVLVVTGDNDILQVVSPQVKVLAPKRSFSDTVTYDEAGVREKYGFGPERLPDYKALVGDASDNIPGVPGIGEKTAKKLIEEFGGLEDIYVSLDRVSPEKLRTLLAEYKDQAFASKELATSVRDVPVLLDLESCRLTNYDRARVVELFRDMEFAKLLPRLPESLAGEEATAPDKGPEVACRVVDDETGLKSLLDSMARVEEFVVELEASSLDPMTAELVGLSLLVAGGEPVYVPVAHRGDGNLPLKHVLARLKPVFEGTNTAKILHNGKYDMSVLANYGIELASFEFDTMIAAHLLGEKSLALKALAFNKLGIEIAPITDLIGSGAKQIPLADVDRQKVAGFACREADVTLRLKRILADELEKHELMKVFREVEMPLAYVLLDMERTGVALDADLLKQMSHKMGLELLKLEADIYNAVGHQFNINSSQQLSRILFEDLKLPKSRKIKGGFSTDATVLEELRSAHPVVELILQYRQLAKLKSTYLDALPELVNARTGRLHTSFNQTGTATGRLSSSEPNLQNLPVRGELGKKIREAIVAPAGSRLLSADYSQIDLRVLAHLSQDPALIAAFLNNEDIHAVTAARLFNASPSQITVDMRRLAKTVNFGVIYGMSSYGLEQATELSREEAHQFIAAYFEKYPRVKEYLEATKDQARRQGYVQTILGRRRYIPEISSPNRILKEAAERMAINMPVQGTSADIIKIAMINLHRALKEKGLKSKMVLQIHDELLFEAPEKEVVEVKKLALEIMPRAIALWVPLKVDVKIGKNWGEMG